MVKKKSSTKGVSQKLLNKGSSKSAGKTKARANYYKSLDKESSSTRKNAVQMQKIEKYAKENGITVTQAIARLIS